MSTLPDYGVRGYRADAVLGRNPEGGRNAYRGVRLRDERAVVIKHFSFASGGASWEGYQAHERELKMLQSLAHPRIPAYLDEFQTEDGFCLVQEFRDARPLSTRRAWSSDEVWKLAHSALELLVYLQERVPPVIHRDLKPENILVDDAGDVHFIDFGLARADRARATTVAVGTPGFMSPEQMWGRELTLSSDLYALGAVLMTAVTGTASTDVGALLDDEFRFDASRLPPNLDGAFRAWLVKMVAPALKERFASAKEALSALDATKNAASPPPARERQPATTDVSPRSKDSPKNENRGQSKPDRENANRRGHPNRAWRVATRNPGKARTQKSTSWTRERKTALFAGILVAIGALGVAVWPLVLEPETATEPRSGVGPQGLTCQGPLRLSEDITMEQQYPPVTALPGCDLVLSELTISSVVGIRVKGGTVRLEGVTMKTQHPAVELESGEAFVSRSSLDCESRCILVRDGAVTVEDSKLAAHQFAVDGSGRIQVLRSELIGNTAALALHSGGEATVVESTLKSSGSALKILNGNGSAHFQGGSMEGALDVGSAKVTGLQSVAVRLGEGAKDTWARVACAPIGECLKSQSLGEYAVDLRVDMLADGTLAPPEFLQKKLDAPVEQCIVLTVAELRVPDPDGQPHIVRCTSSGQLMAGGALMSSTDFRVEN